LLDIQALKIEIGNKLKEAREESGYSQKNLADLIGLTKVGYGALERGQNLVSLQHLIPLARILQKPITYFLPGFVSPQEMNDLSHDPHFPALVAVWPDLDDERKQFLIRAADLLLGQQERRTAQRDAKSDEAVANS